MFKRILTVVVLFILILGLGVAVRLVQEQTKLSSRAVNSGFLSLENSYLFASPLVAKAGGGEKITISAFVLSDQGLGIPGEKVELFAAPALQVVAIRSETDSRGLAVFEVTSDTVGQFTIWAHVLGKGQIKQQVNVRFTNP